MARFLKMLPAMLAALVLSVGPGCAAMAGAGMGNAQIYEVTEPDGSVRYVLDRDGEIIDIDPAIIERHGGGCSAEGSAALLWIAFWFVLIWIELIRLVVEESIWAG